MVPPAGIEPVRLVESAGADNEFFKRFNMSDMSEERTIRNLASLGLISVRSSKDLPVAEEVFV